MNNQSAGRVPSARKAIPPFPKGLSGALIMSCGCGVSELTSRTGYGLRTWEFCFRFRHLACKGAK